MKTSDSIKQTDVLGLNAITEKNKSLDSKTQTLRFVLLLVWAWYATALLSTSG